MEIENSGIVGTKLFPIEWSCVESKSLNSIPPPAYFWPEIHGGIDIDRSLMWEHGSRTSLSETPFRAVPLSGTWSGEDLFHAVVGVPFGKLLCTRNFIKLAYKCRWAGLKFFPMDLPHPFRSSPLASYPIEHLKQQWPPTQWYPEGVEGHPNNLEDVDEP